MTLDEYFKTQAEEGVKLTDAAFGSVVGVSQPHISRLRNNLIRPSWKTMDAIEKATGGKVTASAADWPLREAAE